MTTVDGYWEWREAQLAHPDGRAKGGEPCVVCQQPVPPNAHWQHKDRHVCSPHCNYVLGRRFNRYRVGGKVTPPPELDPYVDREPMFFGMDESLPFPFDFLGWSPRAGDIVHRYGSTTAYTRVAFGQEEDRQIRDDVARDEQHLSREELKKRPRDYQDPRLKILERGVACLHLGSGSTLITTERDGSSLEHVVHQTLLPDGSPGSFLTPFEWNNGAVEVAPTTSARRHTRGPLP